MEQDTEFEKLSDLLARMLEAGIDPKEVSDHVQHVIDEHAVGSQDDGEMDDDSDEEANEDTDEKPMPKGKIPKGKMPLGLTIILGSKKK